LAHFFPAASAAARSSSFFYKGPLYQYLPHNALMCANIYLLFLPQNLCVPVQNRRSIRYLCQRQREMEFRLTFLFLPLMRQRSLWAFSELRPLSFAPFGDLALVDYRLRNTISSVSSDLDGCVSISRVILGEDVVQCQRDRPRCFPGTQSRCQICKSNKLPTRGCHNKRNTSTPWAATGRSRQRW
jgi:hypothetical protein